MAQNLENVEDNDFSKIENELKHELEGIHNEQGALKKLEKEVTHTLEEVEKLEHEKHNHHEHHDFITLDLIVNGKLALTDKVEKNKPLIDAVDAALKKSGNTGRPVSDWQIKYDDKDLNVNAKIGDLKLPECAKIFISLKTAEGGNE